MAAVLADEIRRAGPIPVSRFMELALGDPALGYYRTRAPFGVAGDFVTAPEISQMFGELIGLWLAQAWLDLGQPAPVRLVELGPGRGQLMADLLRTARKIDRFLASLDVHLMEFSARLRQAQERSLAGHRITWQDDLARLPAGPVFCIANEFFDALSVEQVVRTQHAWIERRVALDDRGGLTFVLGDRPSPLADRIAGADTAALGAIAEVSPAREAFVRRLADRLVAEGGLALIIDYGAWAEGPTGDTLQAVRDHRPCHPLSAPGTADLSAQVDFRALATAAAGAGAVIYGPIPQGAFLRTLGIELRTARLLQQADAEQAQALRAALFRLTDPSAMGELYKVLILTAPEAPAPPGCLAPTMLPESGP